MVNIIWVLLIILGILYSLFTNNLDNLNTTIMDSTKVSLDMLFKIFPVLALWMGLTKIAEQSGLLKKLSNRLSPLLTKIFPDIPKEDESLGLIASNVVSNIFGLGSAATPFGLKAMQCLQRLNKKKNTVTKSMITFLTLNTSGLTLIPTTIISLRLMYGSLKPTSIVLACILSTIISTISGLFMDKILQRRYKD